MLSANPESIAAGVLRQIVINNLAKLPPISFHDDPDHGIVLIKRGERGYFTTPPLTEKGRGMKATDINATLGITREQSIAMRVGALFGWHVEGADPDNWLTLGKGAPGFTGKRS